MLFVPVAFIVIGAGGLVYSLLHWGKSAERRSAMSQHAQDRDLFGGSVAEQEFPNVPRRTDITNSPGTKLRYRLPIDTSPGWALFGTLFGCIIWNGLVAIMVYFAVRGHLAGKPDWILTIFTVPFVLGRAVADRLFPAAIAGYSGHRAYASGNFRPPFAPRRRISSFSLTVR